jgi:hypothetical protein
MSVIICCIKKRLVSPDPWPKVGGRRHATQPVYFTWTFPSLLSVYRDTADDAKGERFRESMSKSPGIQETTDWIARGWSKE